MRVAQQKVMEQEGENQMDRRRRVGVGRWYGGKSVAMARRAVYHVSETGGGRPKREGEQKWKEG